MEKLENNKKATVTVIASSKNWIESDAVQQLENTAKLKGICLAVGLPDLHPGKGHPIGAAFVSKEWIYPPLVGNDIGCGMGFWKTDLKAHKMNLDKWTTNLTGLDSPWEGNTQERLQEHGIALTPFDLSLGTIGGGNHFAELQRIESINDPELFDVFRLDKKNLYLLVHSGSRGLGESILRAHCSIHGHEGFHEATRDAQQYMVKHNQALRWAEANRGLIAHRFLSCLQADGDRILDVNHNTVTQQAIEGDFYWLHRKGASPSTEGPVIIPGSRGHFSYLVLPIGPQESNAFSLAHGAGRKWKRSDAKGKLETYRATDFTKTSLGSRVICEDKALIFEEAPQAYKNIDTVVRDLVDAGLVKIIATLRPVVTYKTRRFQ